MRSGTKPTWYDPPSDTKAKEAYDDKVAEFLLGTQTRSLKDVQSRSDNAVATQKLRADNAEALRKSQVESEEKLFAGMIETLRTSAVGAIDRSRDTAKYVQTASIAAAGLYTGLLGFVFSVADTAQDLPLRGAIPTAFFGLAVALSTWYIAFVPDRSATALLPKPSSLPRENAARNLDIVVNWVTTLVAARAWALRASSLFLLLAVAFLPVPFIDPPTIPNLIPATAAGDLPAVTPIPTWPPAPAIAQEKVALELYKRQLDAFEKSVAGSPSSPSRWWDWTLIALAVILGLLAFWVARRTTRTKPERNPRDASGTNQSGRGIGVTPLGRF